MSKSGNLIHCDEALCYIEHIDDPVTKSLVYMVFVHLVKQVQLNPKTTPTENLDMLFLVSSLKDFFAEHEVIALALEGENRGLV